MNGHQGERKTYNMTNVQSVVTPTPTPIVPVTNGIAHPPSNRVHFESAGATRKAKGKAKTGTQPNGYLTNAPTMTAIAAIDAAFEYGSSMAGLDGTLTKALQAFKDNETVQTDMLAALNVGYMMRKLGYDRAKAEQVYGLLKYNDDPKYHDDDHRTFDQQRVMDSVRVIWHRAQKMAGVVKVKSETQIQAEATRAAKEESRKNELAQMEQAWAIVHPDNGTDVATVMERFVTAMRNYHNGHSANFTGDAGSAWRDWLAAAPVAKAPTSAKPAKPAKK